MASFSLRRILAQIALAFLILSSFSSKLFCPVLPDKYSFPHSIIVLQASQSLLGFDSIPPSVMSSAQPCEDQNFLLYSTSANNDLPADIVRYIGSWIDTTDKKNQALLTLPQSIDLNAESLRGAPRDLNGHEKRKVSQQKACNAAIPQAASITEPAAQDPKEDRLIRSNGAYDLQDRVGKANTIKTKYTSGQRDA